MKFQLYQPQAIQELGNRKNQEDSIYPLKGEATLGSRLFLVCDGMGGHDKGEVASAAVCKGLSKQAEESLAANGQFFDKDFEDALAKAYATLDAADVMHEGVMGTTMTCICLHKGGCLAAHIGDSRIYHLRPQTNQILYRSRDHSLVQQLYELGEISYHEMDTSPRKNIILKAMQPYQEERMKASLVHITDIREGDYFYLCSDGMLEIMDDDEIMSILKANTSDEEKVNELIRRTQGNADNHSAYLIRIKAVEHEEDDHLLFSDEAEAFSKNKALHDKQKDRVWDFSAGAQTAQIDPHATAVAANTAHHNNNIGGQPEHWASSASTNQNKNRKNLTLIALIVFLSIALIIGAILLFSGKKETPANEDEDNSQQTEQKEESIKNTIPDEESDTDADETAGEDDAIPSSAKPYLEKKATDKISPIEPDEIPESKPAIITTATRTPDEGSATKTEE
ncbi:MAG: protein phosphatase 2C domain-containing protein [Prevotella sp.]|nr:protein phosphatase 2C domain-containing protein [Prevotella sp.]